MMMTVEKMTKKRILMREKKAVNVFLENRILDKDFYTVFGNILKTFFGPILKYYLTFLICKDFRYFLDFFIKFLLNVTQNNLT